ncbi:MAG: hypothetical protein ACM3JH_08260 [Acidithiobacillales bacterium]
MNLATDSPIAALAAAIEETALRSAEPLQGWMNFPTDSEQEEKWLEIVWEHIFLLMHLVNRSAYGTLDEEAHGRLMGELAPMVVIPLAQELSEGRPDGFTQQITRKAFDGLNRSELDYAKCDSFLAEPILTGNSVVSVFVRKVSRLTGDSMKPPQLAELVRRTVEAYKSLTLKDRIAAVAAFLKSEEPAAS